MSYSETPTHVRRQKVPQQNGTFQFSHMAGPWRRNVIFLPLVKFKYLLIHQFSLKDSNVAFADIIDTLPSFQPFAVVGRGSRSRDASREYNSHHRSPLLCRPNERREGRYSQCRSIQSLADYVVSKSIYVQFLQVHCIMFNHTCFKQYTVHTTYILCISKCFLEPISPVQKRERGNEIV